MITSMPDVVTAMIDGTIGSTTSYNNTDHYMFVQPITIIHIHWGDENNSHSNII